MFREIEQEDELIELEEAEPLNMENTRKSIVTKDCEVISRDVRNVSQVFLDAYEKTQNEELLVIIALRDDVIQTREHDEIDGICRITYYFQVKGDHQLGLNQEELQLLEGKDMSDILLSIYKITSIEEVLPYLAGRKDIIQTREYEIVDEICKITYIFQKK